MKKEEEVGLSLNVIIIAAIALLVLVTLLIIFLGTPSDDDVDNEHVDYMNLEGCIDYCEKFRDAPVFECRQGCKDFFNAS